MSDLSPVTYMFWGLCCGGVSVGLVAAALWAAGWLAKYGED